MNLNKVSLVSEGKNVPISPPKRNPDYLDIEREDTTRYEEFKTIFDNLYENKIIYRERFIVICTIEKLEINEIEFEMELRTHITIRDKLLRRELYVPKQWTASSIWNIILEDNGAYMIPYASYTFWTNPELVRKVEELMLQGKSELALEELYRDRTSKTNTL